MSKSSKAATKRVHKPKARRSKSSTSIAGLMALFPDYQRKKYLSTAHSNQTKYIKELQNAYMYRGLVLYVGAGVSQSVGLPSWGELIRSLTLSMMIEKVWTRTARMNEVGFERYIQAVQRIREGVQKGKDHDRPMLIMARAIKDEFGHKLPQMITGTLSRDLRRQEKSHRQGSSGPLAGIIESELIRALVALARPQRETKGVAAIVNYNYDDILDNALRRSEVQYVCVKSGKDKVPSGALPCYHVHGLLPVTTFRRTGQSATRDNGNFVFSEDEYHLEYSDPYRWSNMVQINLLGSNPGLFVGLSLEDPNIRRLIDVTHRQYPELVNYAILPRRHSLAKSKDTDACVLRNLFEQVETDSFEKIGVRVLWADSYDEIPCILHEIATGQYVTPTELKRKRDSAG